MQTIRAMVANLVDGKAVSDVSEIDTAALPNEEVEIRVEYSGLNYKDALAVCGNRNNIIRSFPFVPGIDLAGTVVTDIGGFTSGDRVVVTGWGIGERHWGGYAEIARVKPHWVTRLPDGMSTRHAMALGTAGLTSLLCVEGLEDGSVPLSSDILVTGATGGVGSIAILILSQLGYRCTAVTSKLNQNDFLLGLGARSLVERTEFSRQSKPLESEKWGGAIDTAGGDVLATVLAQMRYGGVVSACGLAADYRLPTTVMPFILRGVRLQGIDSVQVSAERRSALWKRLATLVPEVALDAIVKEIELDQVKDVAQKMLANENTGRRVVRVST